MLSEFFDNATYGPDVIAEDDRTTILSSGRRSHFKWDHEKNHRHFTHPDSALPSLILYQVSGYFSVFLPRVEMVYNDRVNFDFSSTFSLKLDLTVISDDESDAG